jgi:transposase
MHAYQNTEIANKYNVSTMTVRRWIDQARSGKNNLQLDKNSPGNPKIIKNSHNQEELLKLKQRSFR